MKKIALLIFVFLYAFLPIACSEIPANEDAPAKAEDKTYPESDTVEKNENAPEISEDEPVTNDTEKTPEPGSYSGALSEDVKSDIMDFAAKWYDENFSEYEIESIEVADDTDSGYAYYSGYKPGKLIILLVETSHAPGVKRRCFITISDSGYEVINEGY